MSSISWFVEDKKYLGKMRFRVFLHDTREDMHKETKDWSPTKQDAAAGTMIMNEVICLHFSRGFVELALVAHEATHAVLWAYNEKRTGRHNSGARKEHSIRTWDHPELIADRIGNLTSLVWFGLQALLEEEQNLGK